MRETVQQDIQWQAMAHYYNIQPNMKVWITDTCSSYFPKKDYCCRAKRRIESEITPAQSPNQLTPKGGEDGDGQAWASLG